jgi:hypothetical protein
MLNFVGFEILTAVVMKSSVFWDMTPCSPLKVKQNSRIRWQAATCFHAGFFVGLFFDLEDGGDMFFRTVV